MYIPDLSDVANRHPAFVTLTSLDVFRFTLGTSGVLGIFGGDEAISAMATVRTYKAQRWLGWYNSPGSYQIAKRYGLVATSKIFKGLFPGDRMNPATLFGFDGWQGPRFRGVYSGTVKDSTGHLASVLMKHCATQEIGGEISRRDGPGARVSVVDLKSVPAAEIDLQSHGAYFLFFAFIPILVSSATFAVAVFCKDWASSFSILWGMLSNGISCLVIGSGTLCFTHHIPSPGSPPGDGILDSENEFVLLRGEEAAVNAITLGKISLKFPSDLWDEYIGCCSLFLTAQFIVQLFLISQATLFGQVMFVASLAVSWVYNSCLSSSDKEEIQQRILWDKVLGTPSSIKYESSTRTSAVVFMLCVLSPEDPRKILETYLPNDTKVWRKWRETLAERLGEKKVLHFGQADWKLEGYSDTERRLLETLYRDARAAYDAAKASKLATGNLTS